jgi:hypothetical protein
LVWQRSQTNFIRNVRGLPRGPAYHTVSAEPGWYYNHRRRFLKLQRGRNVEGVGLRVQDSGASGAQVCAGTAS